MSREPRYVDANFAPLYLNTTACKQIKMMPTEQNVVKVVRCKDCKYRKTEYCAMQYECECGSHSHWERDIDFCSWGKRKENGIDDE